ncbi:hypothetical protein LOZ86_14125 [Pectobacterium parvum]|uniref:Uncharacterized protein n=1 Tax=Pectobacterium parvum TaxID=2778550 RepID=A0AAP9INJ3_9GAMM|nr:MULTISPECIES: hypothetical protein [Pectobacterium]GKW43424.1 hypothetical protein PEC301879_32820 [Pectobacterium carotovorum subsp. carotovorum]KFX14239.1 hypothetical protein KP17_10125 [Pectobacterium parvum]KHS99887.1 hypothetical protein RC88_01050 [Pectobacterium parvum]QHQ26418.1 hypothetical protein GMX10_22115 [Pectobacterium parvum]UFK38087.1 hypothetical protein LOZ86_14125 [Pectobacterium parvum]
MKKGLSVLFLSLVATQASAFQAKIAQSTETGLRNIDEAKHTFSGFTPMGLPGQCDATAINGCGCPFCTQLRLIGR